MRYEKELKIWNARYFMIRDNVMNGNELSPPSTKRIYIYIYVYITLRPRLALIERKLMKPILRRNKFVQPLVCLSGTIPHENILTCRNVSCTCKVSLSRDTFRFYKNTRGGGGGGKECHRDEIWHLVSRTLALEFFHFVHSFLKFFQTRV